MAAESVYHRDSPTGTNSSAPNSEQRASPTPTNIHTPETIPPLMKRTILCLTALLVCLVNADAAISVGPAGAGPISFDTLPPAGEWSTRTWPGGAGDITDAGGLDLAAKTNNAAIINAQLTSNSGNPPAAGSTANWSSTGHYIQTSPTGVGGEVILATLANNSGADSANLFLSYDLTAARPLDEVIHGHLVYYSFTGATQSWVQIPELSNQPDDNTAGTHAKTTTVELTATWTNGGTLYVLWVDDNGVNSPDTALEIDNVVFATHAIVPTAPSITQQPTTTTVLEEQIATLSVSAEGTGPLTYQWFQGTPPGGTPIVGATSSSLVVTNINGSGRAWSVPGDSGDYYVVVTGAVPPPVTSSVAHVTVTPDTTAPKINYVICSQTDATLLTVVLSEPLAPDLVTDTDSWAIKAGTNPEEAPASVDYTPNTTTVTLHLSTARDPFVAYTVRTVVAMNDRAVTPNTLPAGTTVRVNCFATELLPLTATWRYLDNDSNPGDSWFTAGFDDSAWSQGAGPFDAKSGAGGTAGSNCRDTTLYSLGAVGTCLRFTNSIGNRTTNCYFRTHFNYLGYNTNTVLQLNGKFDDCGIVFLNGVQLNGIQPTTAASDAYLPPSGPVPRAMYGNDLGSRTVGDGDPQDVGTFGFPASLNHGDNMIAVMQIQGNNTSSDITMGLRVASLTQDLLVLPRLIIDPLDLFFESNVHWTGPGVLQEATRPTGPWTDVDGNPDHSYDIFPTADTGDTGNRYFRLRQP
jgi:hypothetical protein